MLTIDLDLVYVEPVAQLTDAVVDMVNTLAIDFDAGEGVGTRVNEIASMGFGALGHQVDYRQASTQVLGLLGLQKIAERSSQSMEPTFNNW